MTAAARRTFIASFLGWTLDAFDYFLLTFVIARIATTFDRTVADIAVALTVTLACRPIGALIFGWLGDRYGRRTPLMIDIGLYSLIQLLTAFSPNFTVFLVLRALFGVAMGGEWGLGAALTMEALPPNRRGFFSGFLQQGYMVGFLLAALVYNLVFSYTHWDWRALFVIGALPALVILYIRSSVPESEVWKARRADRSADRAPSLLGVAGAYWPLLIYAVVFMAAFNGFSHGTQDLYATFLQKQHGFAPSITSTLAIIAALGAIVGGICGGMLSERIGRRPVIMLATLLSVCVVPLWAFSQTVALLAAGAFIIQFGVQGAWGVVPAHLNELSPADARGTFPGFTYQLGNLIAAGVAQIEAHLAQQMPLPGGGPNYGAAMAIVAATVAAATFILAALGYFIKKENRTASFLPSSEGSPMSPASS